MPNCAWVWWWRRPSLGDRDESVLGELRDLSQDGCQLELPLAASGVLAETDAPLKIALTFPNGTYFEVHAVARHQKPTLSVTYCALASVLQAARPNKSARFGTSSARSSAKRRVIKKEAQEERQPSPLFEQPSRRAPDTEHVGRRDIRRYATPMARRLVKVAAFGCPVAAASAGGATSIHASFHAMPTVC